MEENTRVPRVRGNFSINAKGSAQIDVTAEMANAEDMETNLRNAFASVMKVLKENNIKPTHEVEITKKDKE